MSDDLGPYLEAIEEGLQLLLTPPDHLVRPMYGMMQYHMGWVDAHLAPVASSGGKRIRPLLCLLASEAVSGAWQTTVPAACALELIHNFSLLHDDIQDQSDTRRHRPTAWAIWGVAQALNAGDAMWAISRLATHGLSTHGHPPACVLRVFQLLDATCLLLCKGQYLDLHFESVPAVPLAHYERMVAGKTAALLSASLASGAILGCADEPVVDAFSDFGRELGVTFQIVDDILGIWGDASVTGKSNASDITSRKKTLPTLYALEWEAARGLTDLATLYALPALGDDDVAQALLLLERSGARAYAEQAAHAHQARTMAHLEATGLQNAAVDRLRDITTTLLSRAS